jgi:hypothetical protein
LSAGFPAVLAAASWKICFYNKCPSYAPSKQECFNSFEILQASQNRPMLYGNQIVSIGTDRVVVVTWYALVLSGGTQVS